MTAKPVILVVDDEITNIEIVSAALEDEYEISLALSGDQALEIAHLSNPDLILLDVVMPGLDGYEVCRRLKQDSLMADVPVIFTTSMDGAEAEVRGLSAGAIDYVTKPFQPVALRQRIGNHVQMKRARDELSELAMHDPLTGLANRRLLEQRLHSELAQQRDGGELALLLLDIDYFKRFNDTYGHPAGDHCLDGSVACCAARCGAAAIWRRATAARNSPASCPIPAWPAPWPWPMRSAARSRRWTSPCHLAGQPGGHGQHRRQRRHPHRRPDPPEPAVACRPIALSQQEARPELCDRGFLSPVSRPATTTACSSA